eukprot:2237565-Rhodomonas_salina.2
MDTGTLALPSRMNSSEDSTCSCSSGSGPALYEMKSCAQARPCQKLTRTVTVAVLAHVVYPTLPAPCLVYGLRLIRAWSRGLRVAACGCGAEHRA